MYAEIRNIEANDIPSWPDWSPPDPLCELQWFTVSIGPHGDPGCDYFQVAVATPFGLKERRQKGKFAGLMVERFEPKLVEAAIFDFVDQARAPTWQGIVELLRKRMLWEYEGLHKQ